MTKHIPKIARRASLLFLCIGLLGIILAASNVRAQPTVSDDLSEAALLQQLEQSGSGDVRISFHAETGKVRFIGTEPGSQIAQPARLRANASAADAAMGFLTSYGSLFGLTDPSNELSVMKERELENGRSFIRFQQTYKGVPIIGGELIVQVDNRQNIHSANGEILPDLHLDVTPAITAETAVQTALAKVAKDYDVDKTDLIATEPELWIYHPAIMGGPGIPRHTLVWRIEVTPVELMPIREFVLIDAQLGAVTLSFNQTHTIKNRLTYDAENGTTLPGTLRCNESNPTCSGGDEHEVAAHQFAGDTYDFYMAEHGRDSIDNAGMALISTVHYGTNYNNAFWNGTQMGYGDGGGYPFAEDVVAHELTHGVTGRESNLFYYYQSGAINESFSDIWGEFVDLEQATENDVGDTRWELGEDVTGIGAIRNMQNPPAFGHPDRIGSENYYCEQTEIHDPISGDNGGVHINSGVNNKAAYLMTDGGTFNGITVTGLGYAKVADLYYAVNTTMLNTASDYADLYDALIQASINLGFSAADRQEVLDALNAVEMNQTPACAMAEAPVCTSGVPIHLFFDDIESGGGNWAASVVSGSSNLFWFVPQTTAPFWNFPYATSGTGNIWGSAQGGPEPGEGASDTALAMKSNLLLPANAFLHFNHAFGFESTTPSPSKRHDGGILEYSTNGGTTWQNSGALFTHNGYNGTLEATNPLGAIPAFSADSGGYTSSRLDLSSLAGQNVRFRFRIGTDAFIYDYGWFIDDVRIYVCGEESVYLPFVIK